MRGHVLSDAMHDFDKRWNRTHDHEAKLCAFDLLELDGEDYRSKLSDFEQQLASIMQVVAHTSPQRHRRGICRRGLTHLRD
jgi:hypothetical protein